MSKRINPKELSAVAHSRKAQIEAVEAENKARSALVERIWNQQKKICLLAALNGETSVQIADEISRGGELSWLGFKVLYAHVASRQKRNEIEKEEAENSAELAQANSKVLEYRIDIELFLEREVLPISKCNSAKKALSRCILDFSKYIADIPVNEALANYLINTIEASPEFYSISVTEIDNKISKLQTALITRNEEVRHLKQEREKKVSQKRSNRLELEILSGTSFYDITYVGNDEDYFVVDWKPDKSLLNWTADSDFSADSLAWLAGKRGQHYLQSIEQHVKECAENGMLGTKFIFDTKKGTNSRESYHMIAGDKEFKCSPNAAQTSSFLKLLGYSCSTVKIDRRNSLSYIEIKW